ncbi:MFS transporter [Streptomyces lunalinharesii]|uniref:MFS transporter n=1 Tax=Streptomyces lunalinharesii TaxID=333384 RepID=A0ABN3T4A0_9ACTN
MSETVAAGRRERMPFSLVVAAFWSTFDRFVVTPMLVAIAAGMHARLAEAVAVASAYFLAYGCLQPAWGMLSDRFGRVRMLRFALLGALAGGALSALAPSMTVLLIARVITGACYGGVNPTAVTYVGDTVPAELVKRALSPFYAAGGVGTAAGIALGGIIAAAVSWRAGFALPAIAALVLCLVLRRLPEPAHAAAGNPWQQIRTVLRSGWALLVIGSGFLMGAAVLGCVTFLPALLEHHGHSASVAGLVTAVFGLSGLAWSLLYNALTRTLPRWALIGIGGVLVVAALLVASMGARLVTVVIAAVLLGGGWMFGNSSLAAWAATVLPQVRGTAVALYVTGLFVGGGVAPALAAGPVGQGRYSTVFLTGAALAALTTVIATLGDQRFNATRAHDSGNG